MEQLLDKFLNLSGSGKLVIAAAVLFFILFVYYYLPSKDDDEDTASAPQKKKQADPEPPQSKPKKGWSLFGSAKKKGPPEAKTKHSLFSSREKKPNIRTEPKLDSNNLNSTMEILTEERPNLKDFTHPRATDHFKEEVEPISTDPKDLRKMLKDESNNYSTDELNGIFTTMIKAGAISAKNHLVTNFEHQYLEKLRIWFGYRYHVYCQVSVGSALGINADVSDLNMKQRMKFAQKCHNMSFDFMLIDKNTDRIRCAIELDDPTHNRQDRQDRDKRLDMVCMAAQIPLFHITNVYQKPKICALETQEIRRMNAERKRGA